MQRAYKYLPQIGRALFGDHWLQPLSRELGVNDRTIRRWAKDEFAIPKTVWDEIEHLCLTRGHNLRLIAADLKAKQE